MSKEWKKSNQKKSSHKQGASENASALVGPPQITGKTDPGIITHGPDGELGLRPFPDDLLREAQAEPDRIGLAEYTDTIFTLRNKGFTFREIAEWLGERGVEADHNAVYRIYTRNLDENQMLEEARLQEGEERE